MQLEAITRRATRFELWKLIPERIEQLTNSLVQEIRRVQDTGLQAVFAQDENNNEADAAFPIPDTFTKTSSVQTTDGITPESIEDLILNSSYLDPTLKDIDTQLNDILGGIINKITAETPPAPAPVPAPVPSPAKISLNLTDEQSKTAETYLNPRNLSPTTIQSINEFLNNQTAVITKECKNFLQFNLFFN